MFTDILATRCTYKDHGKDTIHRVISDLMAALDEVDGGQTCCCCAGIGRPLAEYLGNSALTDVKSVVQSFTALEFY